MPTESRAELNRCPGLAGATFALAAVWLAVPLAGQAPTAAARTKAVSNILSAARASDAAKKTESR